MAALKRIVRDVVIGIVALVVAAEALISLPTLLADLSAANLWVHHHLSSRVGSIIGAVILGVALAGFILEVRAGSKRRQRIAGGSLLVIIGAGALIAFPFGDFMPVQQNPAPSPPSIGISSNRAVWKQQKIDSASAAEKLSKKADPLLGSAQSVAAIDPSLKSSNQIPKASASDCGCPGKRLALHPKPESQVQIPGEATREPSNESVDESTDEEGVAVESEAESSTISSGSTTSQSHAGNAAQGEAAATAAEAQAEAAAEAASVQAEAASIRAEVQAEAAEARAEAQAEAAEARAEAAGAYE